MCTYKEITLRLEVNFNFLIVYTGYLWKLDSRGQNKYKNIGQGLFINL